MEDELKVVLPNEKEIACLTCKWGKHNYLAEYCVKYNLKPKNVMFENKECDKYEKDID